MIVKTMKMQAVDWESDYETRINPALMNELLWKAVPALKASNWNIVAVGPGYCESMLPLNQATTNQHGTHQAALISLSADYTGGMALTTLLRGVPLAGIHRCQAVESASLWLAAMNVRYINPSTGHLIGRCRVPEKETQTIVNRYAQGKRVLVTLPIEFESNGQKVAEAELIYFAQPTIQLLETGKKPSALFSQKIKASARMIAGVRASTYKKLNGELLRFDCPYSTLAAGPQGQMLAQRLKAALPQLSEMVLARTEHADETIRSIPGLKQVVLMGAGLDMRAFRLRTEMPDVEYVELDLPSMLEERERVISQFRDGNLIRRTSIAADFIHDDLGELLSNCGNLNPNLPTAFIYEGCSMYFERAINEKVFGAMRQVMLHPDSRVWSDFVTNSVVLGKTEFPEVERFLGSMDDLGESFIFGHDTPAKFVTQCGFRSYQSVTVGEYRRQTGRESNDPVLDVYQFNVAGGN
jgi:methyltransferase (TIGR00027 family)